MKNYIGQGESLTLTAPTGGVLSGVPVVVGNLLVIPKNNALAGEKFTALWRGQFALPKAADDEPGELVACYWDVENKVVTQNSEGNGQIGFFCNPGQKGQTDIDVLLTGITI